MTMLMMIRRRTGEGGRGKAVVAIRQGRMMKTMILTYREEGCRGKGKEEKKEDEGEEDGNNKEEQDDGSDDNKHDDDSDDDER